MLALLRRPVLSTLVVGSLLLVTAHANDGYVDVHFGNDANSGLTPQAAFKTITHATGQVGALGLTVLHVAPGAYSAASGETLPLYVGDLELNGTEGSARTSIVGAPGDLLLTLDNGAVVEGLTLRSGSIGVLGIASESGLWWRLRDVVIDGMTSMGLTMNASSSFLEPPLFLEMRHVHFSNCHQALLVESQSTPEGGTLIDVLAEDCSAQACGYGLEINSLGLPAYGFGTFRRCTFIGNGGEGLSMLAWDNLTVSFHDSLVAGNQGDGARFITAPGPTQASFQASRNTFAHNTGIGLGANFRGSATPAPLRHNIAWGNGDDVALHAAFTLKDCDIGDGDQSGFNGNFSLDPQFLNPAGLDFRLAGTSPCVDLALFIPYPDATGIQRGADGNLDGVNHPDLGALEHLPLTGDRQASIGTTATLEVFGPGGGSARVFGMFGGPISPPIATPFGLLYLDRPTLFAVGFASTDPSTPGLVPRMIPNDPLLIGTHLAFQSWTTSTIGSPHRLLTQVHVLELVH